MRQINSRLKIYIFTSLILLFILPVTKNVTIFASDIFLNSALTVEVPDTESGNPGDFLTYVLLLHNRSNNPINLQVEYFSQNKWTILGDPTLTVSAQTNNKYFPITILIPQDAIAGQTEQLQLRFKIIGEPFSLPTVYLPIKVNPVSQISFSTTPFCKGTFGSTISHQVTVTNNGNTVEQVSVKATSANNWEISLEPKSFSLNPGQSIPVNTTVKVPFNSQVPFDTINLVFSWSTQQKIITVNALIVDKLDTMADSYYLWKGQFSLGHPNIADLDNVNTANSFSLQGQWTPNLWSEFYFSDLLNPENKRWFTDIKYLDWELKTGIFALNWDGLTTSELAASGNLLITNKLNYDQTKFLSIYAWESNTNDTSLRPLAIEAGFSKHHTLRMLYDPQPDFEKTITEWEYRNSFNQNSTLQFTLVSNIDPLDTYGYQLGLDNYFKSWYWSSSYQDLNNLLDYEYQRKFGFLFGQPPSNTTLSPRFQLNWESSLATELKEDCRIEAYLLWPARQQLSLIQEYHQVDNLDSRNSTSLFFGYPSWETTHFKHVWQINFALDRYPASDSSYALFDWSSDYNLDKFSALLFKAQLAWRENTLSNNESNISFGLRKNWDSRPELTTLVQYYFDLEPRWKLDTSLDWQIYQYQLLLRYLGYWDEDSFTTELFSLTFNKHFSIPVKKPLATVAGVAFIDSNRNGTLDKDEPVVRQLDLLLDGKINLKTDDQGHYRIDGLEPTKHQVSLNKRYQIIYELATPEKEVSLRSYQTFQYNLPLIRSQNIIGTIFLDKNSNRVKDIDENYLPGIPILLLDELGKEVQTAYTDNEGLFIFYQLQPANYYLNFNPNLLPDNLTPPAMFTPLTLNGDQLEDLPQIEFSLVPFEKPIEFITPNSSELIINLDRELVEVGKNLLISIECKTPLRRLELLLPTGEKRLLDTSKSQTTKWTYIWKVPPSAAAGQAKIVCEGVNNSGHIISVDINLIIMTEALLNSFQY